jgi:hypothetical protein
MWKLTLGYIHDSANSKAKVIFMIVPILRLRFFDEYVEILEVLSCKPLRGAASHLGPWGSTLNSLCLHMKVLPLALPI